MELVSKYNHEKKYEYTYLPELIILTPSTEVWHLRGEKPIIYIIIHYNSNAYNNNIIVVALTSENLSNIAQQNLRYIIKNCFMIPTTPLTESQIVIEIFKGNKSDALCKSLFKYSSQNEYEYISEYIRKEFTFDAQYMKKMYLYRFGFNNSVTV